MGNNIVQHIHHIINFIKSPQLKLSINKKKQDGPKKKKNLDHGVKMLKCF